LTSGHHNDDIVELCDVLHIPAVAAISKQTKHAGWKNPPCGLSLFCDLVRNSTYAPIQTPYIRSIVVQALLDECQEYHI
jgi:hypothetical protein